MTEQHPFQPVSNKDKRAGVYSSINCNQLHLELYKLSHWLGTIIQPHLINTLNFYVHDTIMVLGHSS